MKKIFFDISYIATIITISTFLVSFILADLDFISQIFFHPDMIVVRGVFLLLLFVLWIKCIIVWAKNDRNTIRFLLLLFLQGFYMLYYYPRIRKRNWL